MQPWYLKNLIDHKHLVVYINKKSNNNNIYIN